MDSLQKVLKNKKIAAPDEIKVIKDYIMERYQSTSGVKLANGALIISVPNSALAATLHLEQRKLITACGLQDKKLVFRNGQQVA